VDCGGAQAFHVPRPLGCPGTPVQKPKYRWRCIGHPDKTKRVSSFIPPEQQQPDRLCAINTFQFQPMHMRKSRIPQALPNSSGTMNSVFLVALVGRLLMNEASRRIFAAPGTITIPHEGLCGTALFCCISGVFFSRTLDRFAALVSSSL
jgi:hypothetical protein